MLFLFLKDLQLVIGAPENQPTRGLQTFQKSKSKMQKGGKQGKADMQRMTQWYLT